MTSSPGASTSIPPFEVGTIDAQARTENFPVATVLLPRRERTHLLAIYGFARLADDIGDEAEGDRAAQLDWLEAELERAAGGTASHPILLRLAPTIRDLDLPLDPFRSLIEANRVDQVVARYETFEQLVEYCQLSAVPVGRLVLAVFGAATPERIALADDVCVGLQLAEHLQDVAEDAARGRIYLPRHDMEACGVGADDLAAAHASPALRRLVAVQANRAHRRLASGAALAASLPWQPRVAVAGFAGGGLAALDAIRHAGYDVLGVRCRPRPHRLGARMVESLGRSSKSLAPSDGAAA